MQRPNRHHHKGEQNPQGELQGICDILPSQIKDYGKGFLESLLEFSCLFRCHLDSRTQPPTHPVHRQFLLPFVQRQRHLDFLQLERLRHHGQSCTHIQYTHGLEPINSWKHEHCTQGKSVMYQPLHQISKCSRLLILAGLTA